MNDLALAERKIFETISPALVFAFYVLAIVALAIFLYGLWQRIAKYRAGKPADRFDGLWTRAVFLVRTTVTHATLRKRNGLVGLAHGAIFWGFIGLFLGTVVITIDHDIVRQIDPGLQFWKGAFYQWYSLLVDLAGLALLLGLAVMAVRRWVAQPRRLRYDRQDRARDEYDRSGYIRDDQIFLWGLILIGASGFLIEALRISFSWPPFEIWSVVGWNLAALLSVLGLSPDTARALHPYVWWGHAVLVLCFIAYLPFSKAVHMFTGPASLFFRDPLAGKRLPGIPADAITTGYADLEDFTWKEILDLDACTKCGRCHDACPARAGGWPLSPRDIILELRENAEVKFGGRTVLHERVRNGGSTSGPVSGVGVRAETLWSCTTCLACVEACPVGVEHVPMIVQMRRKLVETGKMDGNLQAILEKLAVYGNSFGAPESDRGNWTEGLDFEVKDARREPVDFLWFVGDFASYDPKMRKITQAMARIFHASRLDFGILYDGERNAGNDVRRIGEEGLFELLKEHNVAALTGARLKRIITTDPHSHNTLSREYEGLGVNVYHYSEVIRDLIRDKRLPIARKLSGRVTYHDPCHLSRYAGVTEPPREIMTALGLTVVEMKRSRANSFCCGAGGGRIWMTSRGSAERPSEQRIKEALDIDGLNQFIVACPKCYSMHSEAITATGNKDRLVVTDLIELIEEAAGLSFRSDRIVDAV